MASGQSGSAPAVAQWANANDGTSLEARFSFAVAVLNQRNPPARALAVLSSILFQDCTADVLPGCCRDDHLFVLSPYL